MGGGKGGGSGGSGGKGASGGGSKGSAGKAAGSAAGGNPYAAALKQLSSNQLLSGGLSALGALGGSALQANSANQAAQTQQNMFNTVAANNAPYNAAGQQALSSLGNLLGTSGNTSAQGYGSLTTPFTTANLNSQLAPNYQFQLQQGLGTLNNQLNATGGLVGGNAIQGAQNYAQNFAQNAYQNAFNNYQTQNSNIYNRLGAIAGLGQGAASNQATGASQFGGNIGTQQAAAGTALGGGVVGAANAGANAYGTSALINAAIAAGQNQG